MVLKSPASTWSSIAMLGDAAQQRAQFVHAPLFRPGRDHRAQVNAEDADALARGHDLDETRAARCAASPIRRTRPVRG